MSKLSPLSKATRMKALPWAMLLQGGMIVGKRWKDLSPKDRARLTELTRASGGRPGNLSAKERGELRALVGKLDLKGAGRELLPLARKRRR